MYTRVTILCIILFRISLHNAPDCMQDYSVKLINVSLEMIINSSLQCMTSIMQPASCGLTDLLEYSNLF